MQKAPAFHGSVRCWLWPPRVGAQQFCDQTRVGSLQPRGCGCWPPHSAEHLSPSWESASQWVESYSLREAFSSLYKALHEWHCRLRSLSLLSISVSFPCRCFIFLVSFVVLSLFEPNLVSMRSQWDFVALFSPLSGMRGNCFPLEKCKQCSAWRPGHCAWPFALVTDPHFIQTHW